MRGLILLCVVLCGCAAPPRPTMTAEALVVAFADDFHSGIVLERAAAPPALLPPLATAPWIAFHFGERRWIRGEADGICDALRLGVCSGEGGVQVDAVSWWVHARGGTDPSRVRVWAFLISCAELTALQARLDSWVSPGAASEALRPGSCWWPAQRNWSVRTNCHDFTVDLLQAAGIPVDQPPIMLAAPLRAALDRAWSARDLPP
jgi:hypothetical protein